MHQVAISTVDKFNGADLGIREEWVPLFDKYGVDLVVCGHEHHYERSHPIRGREQNATLTPVPVATATDVIDTTKGTVHMVIGGGGTSLPSNTLFFDPPQCRVITPSANRTRRQAKRPPVYVKEQAPWSAVRNAEHSCGFAASIVDPGSHSGDFTTIEVTYYDAVNTVSWSRSKLSRSAVLAAARSDLVGVKTGRITRSRCPWCMGPPGAK